MSRGAAVQFVASSDRSKPDRRWCGNDDSARNHHGVIPLSSSPVDLELSWKASKNASAKVIGRMRLDLQALLAEGLVRREDSESVRVRFFHDDDGKIYIQTKLDESRFLVGRT